MSVSSNLYAIARRVFWAMPAVLRNRLHGFRHRLVRWLRLGGESGQSDASGLSLQEFQSAIGEKQFRQVIVFEANLDWNITLYQRPHHMALAMGRLGCLVLYRTTGDRVAGFRQVEENVWLTSTDKAPFAGAVRCFYSTSLFASAKDLNVAASGDIICYEYIDHIDAAISGGQANLRRLQELKNAAFARADLVVSSAGLLHEEATQECGQQRSLCIPNGVDTRHYRNEEHASRTLKQKFLDFRARHEHVIGYFGAIAPWLWYELIDELCLLMPDKGFIFIGPDYSGCVPRLPQHPNALYLGPVSYDALPAYAAKFDVCFIPFMKGEIARSTSPLKLFEYFALEKPVVVTSDMLECTAFSEVFSGADAQEIAGCIEAALELRTDSNFKARLGALADANSWDVRAEAYLSRIESLPGHCAG